MAVKCQKSSSEFIRHWHNTLQTVVVLCPSHCLSDPLPLFGKISSLHSPAGSLSSITVKPHRDIRRWHTILYRAVVNVFTGCWGLWGTWRGLFKQRYLLRVRCWLGTPLTPSTSRSWVSVTSYNIANNITLQNVCHRRQLLKIRYV